MSLTVGERTMSEDPTPAGVGQGGEWCCGDHPGRESIQATFGGPWLCGAINDRAAHQCDHHRMWQTATAATHPHPGDAGTARCV
jgi:hypothetical protein